MEKSMNDNPLYVLGMICRVVWPDGIIPVDTLETVLTRPLDGLALIQRAVKPEHQDQVGDLVDKLPADIDGRVTDSDQTQFWLGFYHYLTAMDSAEKYGRDELIAAGEALYGKQWQTDLSRALGLSDARRIRQWISGERPIPVGVWADLLGLLRHREMSIKSILKKFSG
jgi:hypothetical protein